MCLKFEEFGWNRDKVGSDTSRKKLSKIQRFCFLILGLFSFDPFLSHFWSIFNIHWEFHNISNVFSSFLGAISGGPSTSDVNVGDMFFISLQYNIPILIFIIIYFLLWNLSYHQKLFSPKWNHSSLIHFFPVRSHLWEWSTLSFRCECRENVFHFTSVQHIYILSSLIIRNFSSIHFLSQLGVTSVWRTLSFRWKCRENIFHFTSMQHIYVHVFLCVI